MRKYLSIFFIFLILPIINADVLVGTCEGYVSDTEGNLIPNADVTVSVNGCGSGCTQNAVTDSNGYYVVANLNLPTDWEVNANAIKGSEQGSNTGLSNEFQSASVGQQILLLL